MEGGKRCCLSRIKGQSVGGWGGDTAVLQQVKQQPIRQKESKVVVLVGGVTVQRDSSILISHTKTKGQLFI